MNARTTSYEIQVLADKHWVILEMASDEAQAKAFADNALQTGNHAAVRVVKDFRRVDGLHTETVIHEKKAAEKRAGDPQLSSITEAPACQQPADFYGLPSRLTIGRLLRKYLDEAVITPTELLHGAQEMKRFGDKGALLFSAIDRVSTLQARAAGEEAKARRDFLNKAWDQLLARARAAAAKKVPPAKTFAGVLKGAAGSGGEGDFIAMVLMSQALLDKRSWGGKLDLLIDWSAEEGIAGNDKAMAMIDGVVADIVVSAQMIQDLLGFQSNLAGALCHICDLAEGKAEAAKFAPPAFDALNRLFAEGRLSQARQVLLSRIIREVAGVNPLSRNDPQQEYEMFHKVLHRLVGREGVVGGAAAAEGLLQRGARVLNSGGATVSAVEAMELLLSAMSEGCLRLQFLMALAQSPLGQELGEALVESLVALVRKAEHVDAWVPPRVSPRERMTTLTAANQTIKASPHLVDEVKTELADRIDDAMVRYLLDEEVIEKIDKPDDPLALRAIRLVKFCGSGVLIKGKSLNMARARVIDHLRQKQFEEKFLASVSDPVQAERHLREFHRLLVESGFN
jgi:hypothetical protein